MTIYRGAKQISVPVYDRAGRVITMVPWQYGAADAAKAAKVGSCEWTFRFGTAGWIVK